MADEPEGAEEKESGNKAEERAGKKEDEGSSENESQESPESSDFQNFSGGRIQKLRKIILIMSIVAVAGGVALMYSEDLLLWTQLYVDSIIGSPVSAEAAVRSMVLSSDTVKAFMENSTEPELHISYFRINDAGLIFEQMRSDCNITSQTSSTATELYRVIVDEKGSNRSIASWVDWNRRELICAAKKGNWTAGCRTHTYSRCYDNNFYWFNSCGEREDMKLSCFGVCINNTCVPDCVLDGLGARPSDEIACCEDLDTLPNFTFSGGVCHPPINESFICTRCGNGLCQPPENECSCPADCDLSCIDSDDLDYNTQGSVNRNGTVKWDSCINTKSLVEYYCEYKAIRNTTYSCPANYTCDFGKCVYSNIPCLEEGEFGPTDQFFECCKGLKESNMIRDGLGGCKLNPAAFVCIDCGNGICGVGETFCNCYEDCSDGLNETNSSS